MNNAKPISIAINILLIALLALLCACPKGGQQAGTSKTPSVSTESPGGATSAQPGTTNQTSATPPGTTAPGTTPAVEPPNPKPSGLNWVWSPKLTYRIGEPIKADYTVAAIGDPKPWIGLIPASVVAQDEAANDAADISYCYAETPTATLTLSAVDVGQFHIRLLSGGSTGKLLAETPLMNITQWQKGRWEGTDKPPVKPYITISGGPLPPTVVIKQGLPVVAYWETAEAYPEGAWLGLIPTSCTSAREEDNDAVDIQYNYLNGEVKGQFQFMMDKPGEYVFRLFPSSQPNTEWVAESQVWTVE